MVMADFRDQYYGLRGAVVEAPPDHGDAPVEQKRAMPLLVTVGLVDVMSLLWGNRPTRFDNVRYERPVVDRARITVPGIDTWIATRLVPKVLVATQTRVVEAVVDAEGVCVPSVPIVSVVPFGTDVWSLAAVLHAPAVSSWVAHRVAGSALSATALRVSASDLRNLPFPIPGLLLSEAAEHMRHAAAAADRNDQAEYVARVYASGRLVHEAFGIRSEEAEEVTAWWSSRWTSRVG
jgi:hypothetical protein